MASCWKSGLKRWKFAGILVAIFLVEGKKGLYASYTLFNIDIETCESCGGRVKVIASIEDPAVIEHILKHLKQKEANTDTEKPYTLPPERAPPQADFFDW